MQGDSVIHDRELIPWWPDAGRALSISRSKTQELIRSGALPSVKIGRRRLVRVRDLRAYVDRLSSDQGDEVA